MPPRAIVGQHEWIAGPAERPSPDRCTDRKKSWKSGKRSAAPTGDFFVDRKCLSWIGWALPTISIASSQPPWAAPSHRIFGGSQRGVLPPLHLRIRNLKPPDFPQHPLHVKLLPTAASKTLQKPGRTPMRSVRHFLIFLIACASLSIPTRAADDPAQPTTRRIKVLFLGDNGHHQPLQR